MQQAHLDSTVRLTSPDFIHHLEAHVKRRLNGRLRDFRLVLDANGVILHGRTSTYYAKQLAQEAVRQATKLPILANVISVGDGPFLDDAGDHVESVELTDETFLEEEVC
ncbi:MAG TPA: hypothetical protein VGZ47_07345 [Gemmataceae bacterium]|nr:hypothetical protein [Gemmataceae bacterium]